MRTRIRATSKEYVGCPVSEATGQIITGDTVELCLTATGVAPTSWTTGLWETIGGSLWAVVLIGPGSTIGQLAPGQYYVNVRVTDSPEVPVLTAPNAITIY